MEGRIQKTIAMDPIAAAFEELYEKSPIPMLIPHLFTISDGHHRFAPSSTSGSFIRPPPKPKKKSILQSLKNLSDDCSLLEQDSLLDNTVDFSEVEGPSIASQFRPLYEDVTVDNNNTKQVSDKMTVDVSEVESPSSSSQFHPLGEDITVDNNNTKDKDVTVDNNNTKDKDVTVDNNNTKDKDVIVDNNNTKDKDSDNIVLDRSKKTSLLRCTKSTGKSSKKTSLLRCTKSTGKRKRSDERNTVAESSQNAANSKVYVLSDWSIRPAPKCRGILVEGKLYGSDDGDVLWHSSPVTKRIQIRTVLSGTGSTYKLKGRINHLVSLESGFIMPVVLKFKNGFPVNWLEIIAEYYDGIESSGNQDHLPNDNQSTPANMKISNKCNNLVSTPTGMVDVESLPRTKSGRRVKPPLAWWMGQRTLVDPVTDKLSIKCTTEKAESVLNHLALDASKSTKASKHTSHTATVTNCKTESGKLKTEVMNIIQSSKAEHLSKKVKSRVTCYSSENDTEKLKNPVVVSNDIIILKKKQTSDANPNPFDLNSDSDDQNTTQKHTVKTRRGKSVRDSSSSGNAEKCRRVDISPHRRCLRQRTMINYKERNSIDGTIKSKKTEKKSKSKQIIVAKLAENCRGTKRRKSEKSVSKLEENGRATKRDKLSKQKCEKKTRQNDPDYRNAISNVVQPHSAAERQELSLHRIPAVKPKKTRDNTSSASSHKCITAGVGTLKRKQQIRDLLDKQNEGYNGGLFDSTPLQMKALQKVQKIYQLDDAIDVFGPDTPGDGLQTPGITYTLPVRSPQKTPFTNMISPWLEPVQRKNVDQFINQVLKNKRKRIPKTHQTPSRPSDEAISRPVKALFVGSEDTHSLFKVTESIEEVEEDEDYYWNEEMEN